MKTLVLGSLLVCLFFVGCLHSPKAIFAEQDADVLAIANKYMSKKVLPLIPKDKIAPSGDPHDYFSLSPYSWPDPTKADGLPYIYRDGVFNPERANFDQPKFTKLIRAVSALNAAHRIDPQAGYDKKASEWLSAWFVNEDTRMNPNMNYAQQRPGFVKLSPSGIIEARELSNLIAAVIELERAGALTPDVVRGTRDWLSKFLVWLVESPSGKKERATNNNHAFWYDATAASIAEYTGKTALLNEILVGFGPSRIAAQFDSDGSQPQELKRTRAWHYSVFNLQAAFKVADIGNRSTVDIYNYKSPTGASLRKAVDWLIPFGTCEKPFPYQQIDPPNRPDFAAILKRAAQVWRDPAYEAAAGRLCENLLP